MVGQGKAEQACSKGFSQRFEEDMISQLPDPLICHILYHLPKKGSCKETSVLSARWRSLWLWVPSLELNSLDFADLNAFVSVGDRFFNSDRASCIHKLKLTITIGEVDNDASYATSWIDAAIKRKVQHLDLHWYGVFKLFTKSLKLYNCETLVNLKLFEVPLDSAEFVYLPCLKTMHLEDNWFPNEDTFEKLVSSCPVLEELKLVIHKEDTKAFRVHSRSLKKLKLVRSCFNFLASSVSGVVIDAPLLCCLRIYDYASQNFIIKHLESTAKLDIRLLFGSGFFDEDMRRNVQRFLHGITRVSDMTLCGNTFQIICQYSKMDMLPHFGYMSNLHVSSRISDLACLPTFLESCPNLKSLLLSNANSLSFD